MSDLFYNLVWALGAPAFITSGKPTILGREHVHREGPFILAANHQAAYDVPLLMLHMPRLVDFVSIVEVFRNPFVGWFYGSMNAFPLDRGRPDAKTVRVILDRLQRGRVVCMFPEGGFRKGGTSMVHTGKIKPGIGRIAQLAKVPIVPCAIIGSPAYSSFKSWLPLRRTRYGIAFGQPIDFSGDLDTIEATLIKEVKSLHDRLADSLGFRIPPTL